MTRCSMLVGTERGLWAARLMPVLLSSTLDINYGKHSLKILDINTRQFNGMITFIPDHSQNKYYIILYC